MTDLSPIPRPFTPHEILSALTEAREREAHPTFLAGYDRAVEQVRRMSDYPWHDLRSRGGEP